MSIPVERLERHVAVSAPPITIEVFESFLQCETKSKLYFQGAAETDSEFKNWLRRQQLFQRRRHISAPHNVSRRRVLCWNPTCRSSQTKALANRRRLHRHFSRDMHTAGCFGTYVRDSGSKAIVLSTTPFCTKRETDRYRQASFSI